MNASTSRVCCCEKQFELDHSLLVAKGNPSQHRLSKVDFLRAVATCTSESNKPRLAEFEAGGVESILMFCPYSTWVQAFGEPRDVREHRLSVCQSAIQLWEQPCSDGIVHCLGHFINGSSDDPTVVLTRVCNF